MAFCTADPKAPPEVLLTIPQQFIPSHYLVISCGSVLVDPRAQLVAILHDSRANITQLPKGRKNIDEPLSAAALRETYEETGLKCAPLPLLVATRATVPAASPGAPELTETRSNCEPVAVCTYPCVYTGAFKMFFWFAAQADAAVPPEPGTREPWEEHLELAWVPAREAAAKMTFRGDGHVVEKVLEDMGRSGYDI